MPKPYYGLFTREDGKWSYEFGDFDKNVVKAEQLHWADGVDLVTNKWRRKKDTHIHTWAQEPSNGDIRAETERLNA